MRTKKRNGAAAKVDAAELIETVFDVNLQSFQPDWLEDLFREKQGKRIHTPALLGVPRGNGKSHLAAAVAGYMLLADKPRDS